MKLRVHDRQGHPILIDQGEAQHVPLRGSSLRGAVVLGRSGMTASDPETNAAYQRAHVARKKQAAT